MRAERKNPFPQLLTPQAPKFPLRDHTPSPMKEKEDATTSAPFPMPGHRGHPLALSHDPNTSLQLVSRCNDNQRAGMARGTSAWHREPFLPPSLFHRCNVHRSRGDLCLHPAPKPREPSGQHFERLSRYLSFPFECSAS